MEKMDRRAFVGGTLAATGALALGGVIESAEAERRPRKPSDKVQAVYTVVAEAQRRAIAAMRPGASSKAVDTIARGYIAEQGFGDYFNHGLGHGFGLQHQSSYDGLGNKTDEYSHGDSISSPIMGYGYAARNVWWQGTSSISSTTNRWNSPTRIK